MKHPLRTIIASILGTAVAGVPLFYFAAPPKGSDAPRSVAERQAGQPVPTEIRYTGMPDGIVIRNAGKELTRITPELAGYWYGYLPLPMLHSGAVLELEVEAHWSAPCGSDQVLSLELMPPGLPARRDTRWANHDAKLLHAVFLYRW